jgi:TrmH family RNA methyltransferase
MAFKEAVLVFEQAIHAPENLLVNAQIRRALNNIKHLLLTATGRDQADWDFTANDGSLDPAERQIFEGMWVYMEDIRSPFNVGAMFRTAESFGVEKIILSPFCADPFHRRAQRTAMGCIDIIPWERQELFASTETPMPCPVFALETGGIPINEFPFPRRGLLIAGSEELGVSPHALAAADASGGRVSIPIHGAKASLNVSVAFGIALQIWALVLDGEGK